MPVRRRTCVDLEAALVCSWDRVSISKPLVLFVGISLGGVDRSETRLEFHFEVKFQSLFICISFGFFALYAFSRGDDRG